MRKYENKAPLGLYVHIPFCVQKCNYCDFLSFSADEKKKRQYIDALVREMKSWREKISDYEVDTIFIGGGTPSVLSVTDMDSLFQGISDCFTRSQKTEFTVECNPGTVDEEKLSLYRQAGVNRLSFGMQSTMDEELHQLGRIHNYKQFLGSYELARRVGFDNVNVDIMSAVPKQTLMSYETTLHRVTKLAPEHISSYSLIIEEGTPFYEWYRESPPVDEDTDRRMYECTEEILSAAGYSRYEISNYAKPGRECRHNIKYWRRFEYLGLGLGASSQMGNCRFSNVRDLASYMDSVQSGEILAEEREELSSADEKAEFMYLGLRMMQGISEKEFEENFGENLMECYGKEINRCERQGLLECQGDRIFLTKRGIDVSNRVFAEFI